MNDMCEELFDHVEAEVRQEVRSWFGHLQVLTSLPVKVGVKIRFYLGEERMFLMKVKLYDLQNMAEHRRSF